MRAGLLLRNFDSQRVAWFRGKAGHFRDCRTHDCHAFVAKVLDEGNSRGKFRALCKLRHLDGQEPQDAQNMIERLLTAVSAHVSTTFPPDAMRVALALALFSTWMVVVVLACLKLHTGSACDRFWAAGWLFYSVYLAASMGLVQGPGPTVLNALVRASLGLSAICLAWGSLQFAGRMRPIRELVIGSLIVLIWSFGIHYVVGERVWINYPMSFLLAVSGVATALLYARQWGEYKGARVLTVSLLLWSLHLCLSSWAILWVPALRVPSCFAPVALTVCIALGLIRLAFEQARACDEALSQQYINSVAQRRALEQELRIAEQKYRQLFDSACDAILLVDIATLQITQVNPAAEELTQRTADQLTGRPLRDLCPRLSAPTESLLENKKQVEGLFDAAGEIRIARAEGDQVLCEGTVTLVDCQKQPVLQINAREITTRKRMEQQLRQAEKLSALGQLVAGVAHELNNPLAVVMGYAQLFVKNKNLEERLRQDLQKILHESERAAKIVRNLLTFARPREPHMTVVDLNRIVVDSLETREMEMHRAKVEIVRRLAEDLPPTMADAGQVEQVLVNLLTNSIQALENRPDNRTVEVATEYRDNRIRIVVADNGPGIPEPILGRIFDPFFSTKGPGKGTGLGLSICYSIVEEHKGKIWVETKPGKGTRFFVELPVVECPDLEPPKAVEPPIPQRSTDEPPPRVLIVDDEPGIVDVLKLALDEKGFQTDTAGNGAEALSRLASNEYDLIISDICMPEMNGEKLHAAIGERYPHLQDRIIFVTGDTVSPTSRNFLEQSGVRWLNKPFEIGEIERIVAGTLRNGTARANR
jgi:PAS domain S-box-containing protein